MKKIFFITLLLIGYRSFGQIKPPDAGCYHAAFTGNDSHAQFVSLSQKQIAIEMFFTGWPSNKLPDFPLTKCNEIAANGSIPHITWMIYTSGASYALDAVINGSYDAYISGYADQTKNWGKPLFIRLGHEFNGDWYPYGGANNGGGTLNGFGDPTKADGPERFIAAYKHIHDIFTARGVKNVTWIWCPNNGSSPDQAWNDPVNYYPGDAYVDWIGLDGYNFGITQSWSGWSDFWHVYANDKGTGIYQKFESYNKPMMIAEFASVEAGGSKSDWISKTYNLYLKYSFPKIKAVTWFHVRKLEGGVDTDWRINSSPAALTAYQNAIADPYYVSSIITSAEQEKKIPDFFLLHQNYPNPFNPSTTIKFDLPEPKFVSLKIFDSIGRIIVTLVNEEMLAGKYEIIFNANNGMLYREIASGVYFYSLQAGDFISTKKMIFLK